MSFIQQALMVGRWPIRFVLLMMAILISSVNASLSESHEKPTLQKCDSIRVAGQKSWFPVMYQDNDVYTGLSVRLLERIAQDHQVRIMYETSLPLKRVFLYLKNGRLDVIPASFEKSVNNQEFTVSAPYWIEEVSAVLDVRKHPGIRNLLQLNGLRGAAPRGYNFGRNFEHISSMFLNIKEGTAEDKVMMALALGRSDYVVISRLNAKLLLWQLSEVSKEHSEALYIMDNSLSFSTVSFLISNKSQCSLGFLNEAISEYVHSGWVNRELERILSDEFMGIN